MHSWPVRSVLFAILVAGLAGCTTPVSTNIKPSAATLSKYNDLSDLNVVTTLEKNVTEAKNANMPFLAPHYFREASQILKECQSGLGNKPRDVLVNKAASGEAILEKGHSVMVIVQYRFAKELEYKAQLDEHNAPKLLPKEYEKVMGDFSKLIEKVEREQVNNFDKDKDNLLKALLDLVIKAVQEGALHESEVINTDSKKKNAERQAPATFAEALRIYQEAKSQIAAAHHDTQLVLRLGAQAIFAARHAQQVNDRVAFLQTQLKVASSSGVSMGGAVGSMSGAMIGIGVHADDKPSGAEKASLEKIVLQEEDRLLAISNVLGAKDMRDLPLDKQVDGIKQAAAELKQQSKNSSNVAAQDVEARLKAANEEVRRAAELLAEKDAQISALKEKLSQLEGGAKANAGATEPKKK